MSDKIAICKICGEEFTRTNNAQKICTRPECRRKAEASYRRKSQELHKSVKYCKVCGKEVPPLASKYCGTKCRDFANGRRKKRPCNIPAVTSKTYSLEDIARLSKERGETAGQIMTRLYRGEVL